MLGMLFLFGSVAFCVPTPETIEATIGRLRRTLENRLPLASTRASAVDAHRVSGESMRRMITVLEGYLAGTPIPHDLPNDPGAIRAYLAPIIIQGIRREESALVAAINMPPVSEEDGALIVEFERYEILEERIAAHERGEVPLTQTQLRRLQELMRQPPVWPTVEPEEGRQGPRGQAPGRDVRRRGV